MSGDLALIYALFEADLEIEDGDLVRDAGLTSALEMSLLNDARARDSDILPDGETSQRGWWGDAFPNVEGDRWGSRLWLLAREKDPARVGSRAEEMTREALQWLIEDKVSDLVDVVVEVPDRQTLVLKVTVHRPKSDPAEFRFPLVWAAHGAT
jgi:phage gp46-like protein